jgi:hypothetical protein
MSFLDALFSGAKALVKGLVEVGRTLVREVFQEIDNSSFGKAATRVVSGVADRMFAKAQDLADEEGELAEKYQRDGRRTEADAERLREIEIERDRLREALNEANAVRAAQEFKDRVDDLGQHVLDDDELSANIGLLAAKKCPECGATMQIVQGGLNVRTNKRNFFWRCTAIRRNPCPSITLHPEKEGASVIRLDSADFDTPIEDRRKIWDRQPVVNETHERVRRHIGDEDKQLVCPKHQLPLKLMQARKPTGKLLGSYEFVCVAVNADGSFCDHKVTLQSMPQVAAMLQRTEGAGIIR